METLLKGCFDVHQHAQTAANMLSEVTCRHATLLSGVERLQATPKPYLLPSCRQTCHSSFRRREASLWNQNPRLHSCLTIRGPVCNRRVGLVLFRVQAGLGGNHRLSLRLLSQSATPPSQWCSLGRASGANAVSSHTGVVPTVSVLQSTLALTTTAQYLRCTQLWACRHPSSRLCAEAFSTEPRSSAMQYDACMLGDPSTADIEAAAEEVH